MSSEGRSSRRVTLEVPGSKSITQRALIAAALAKGESRLQNALLAEDTYYLMKALEILGAKISIEEKEIRIAGTGGWIQAPVEKIFLGNNGTALRFLTTLVCLGEGIFLLDGTSRLRERPVEPLLRVLRCMGITIETPENPGCPPILVKSHGLPGGNAVFDDLDSSQYVSSLLLSGPYAARNVKIKLAGRTVSEPYIDMTLQVMEQFGVAVERQKDNTFFVPAGQSYTARSFVIEGDYSSASYFFLAAALGLARVWVPNLTGESVQGDARFLRIIEDLGCTVTWRDGGVEVAGGKLHPGDLELAMGDIPDMVPSLAVLAAFRSGRTVITGASHLRIKESNRLAALVAELGRIGIAARETADGLIIDGGDPHEGDIKTYDDHRIAMSFAIAGLAIPGIRIADRGCVRKSFPGFWEELNKLEPGAL
ncbi:MAG: 3-phosphoshikimate 1-carboxyvinyltransferase [Syntrophus sp. PtaU1.Bin208]|nr:MAG: 3-phosphoshikimate 1-carboxyvinyltransferase [Syntrophus sp. PtaU1.Bin208]